MDFFTYHNLIVAFGAIILLVIVLILVFHKKTINVYYDDVNKVKIKSQVNKKGEKDGKEKIFYRNGKINKISHWKDGYRHGSFTVYWNTGKPYIKGFYVDGKLSGDYVVFDHDGKTVIFKDRY